MRPNILLVVLDGVRASNTSLFSHRRDTTPELRAIADEATVYTQAKAPGNWSLPSHTSIFTGLQVPEHRITVQYDSLRSGHSIWERLRDKYNYRTGLFSQNEFITADQYGLARGFDTVVGPVSARAYPFEDTYVPAGSVDKPSGVGQHLKNVVTSPQPGRSVLNYVAHTTQNIVHRLESQSPWIPQLPIRPRYRSPAGQHIDEFLEWVSKVQQPWSACLNFMDANMMHFPWPEPKRWIDQYQRMIMSEVENLRWDFHSGRQPWWKLQALEPRYDDGIHQLDSKLGKLLRALRSRELFDNTLIVITSDHGDALGEQSKVRPQTRLASHSAGIHESLLHVPLVVSSVGQQNRRTVAEPVSLTRFPDAVEQVIRESDEPASFQSDEPVVAAAYHDRLFEYLIAAREWHLPEYIDKVDTSMFSGDARAVYEAHGQRVRKQVTWGDDQATVEVAPTEVRNRQCAKGQAKVDAVFDHLQGRDVKSTYSEVGSIDESTMDQLSDLGYT